LTSVVLPDSQILRNDFNSLYNNIFTRAPIGYVTRFVTILSTSTIKKPPAISYTFGSSSPTELQGKNYSMQIFDKFGTFLAVRADDGSNKNIWDIVMPWFTVAVNLCVLAVILAGLLGLVIGETEEAVGLELKRREKNRKLFQISTTQQIPYTDVNNGLKRKSKK